MKKRVKVKRKRVSLGYLAEQVQVLMDMTNNRVLKDTNLNTRRRIIRKCVMAMGKEFGIYEGLYKGGQCKNVWKGFWD